LPLRIGKAKKTKLNNVFWWLWMDLSPLDYGTIIAIVGLFISIIKLYLDQRKAKKDLELSKRGLKILSRLVETYRKGHESQLQLQREKLEWEKWKDLAKTAGWVWEHLEEYEEE